MSPHKQRRRFTRGTVCWYLFGFLTVQVGVGITIEHASREIRDSGYSLLASRLAKRRAEAPGRPLLLALGSSRTRMGLDAKQVNEADPSWLTFNFADLGAGPMLEQVFLRRLLAEGVRPDMVMLEIVPLQLASGIGVTAEDVKVDPARLNWTELATIAPNFRSPLSAYGRWLKTRALACVCKQRELHEALGIDEPIAGGGDTSAVDGYGFFTYSASTPGELAVAVRSGLDRYAPKLIDARLEAAPAQAVRDLVTLCRREHLPFALILMPEHSALRALHTPAFCGDLDHLFTELHQQGDFEVIDARSWVPDDGFWDCHHLHTGGAQVFSDRFAREVLPRLRR